MLKGQEAYLLSIRAWKAVSLAVLFTELPFMPGLSAYLHDPNKVSSQLLTRQVTP